MPPPIRRVSTVLGRRTDPRERLPGEWRYSSRLALVLSGGGARAAYQVGVLAGLAERLPGLEFPIVTGVSAGAINAIFLAAHRGALGDAVVAMEAGWRQLTVEHVYRLRPMQFARSAARWIRRAVGRRAGPPVVRGLLDPQPLREFLEASVDLSGIAERVSTGRLRAVTLSATSYATGSSVTFVQGGPDVPTWQRAGRIAVRTQLTFDHVMASAAIPLLFPAVRIGDEFYGDGGVRQTAPLAPAIHLGARAVLVIGLSAERASRPPRSPASRPGSDYPTAAEAATLLLHSIFTDLMEADVERLERVNRLLAAIPPDVPPPDGLQPVELLMLHPTRDLRSLAAGHIELLPRSMRTLVGAMGGQREGAADFLSYLLFHPDHTSQLMQLGYDDVSTHWAQIERFFAKLERAGTD